MKNFNVMSDMDTGMLLTLNVMAFLLYVRFLLKKE